MSDIELSITSTKREDETNYYVMVKVFTTNITGGIIQSLLHETDVTGERFPSKKD